MLTAAVSDFAPGQSSGVGAARALPRVVRSNRDASERAVRRVACLTPARAPARNQRALRLFAERSGDQPPLRAPQPGRRSARA